MCRIYNKTLGTDSISNVCFPLRVFSNRGKKPVVFNNSAERKLKSDWVVPWWWPAKCVQKELHPWHRTDRLYRKPWWPTTWSTACPHLVYNLGRQWAVWLSQITGELCWSPGVPVVWSLMFSRLTISLYWVRVHEQEYAVDINILIKTYIFHSYSWAFLPRCVALRTRQDWWLVNFHRVTRS